MTKLLFLVLVVSVMAMACGEEKEVARLTPTTTFNPDYFSVSTSNVTEFWEDDGSVAWGDKVVSDGTSSDDMLSMGNATEVDDPLVDDPLSYLIGGTGHVPTTFDPPRYLREWRVDTPMGKFYTDIQPQFNVMGTCIEIMDAAQEIGVDPYLTRAAGGGHYNISKEYRQVDSMTICGDYQLYHKDNVSYWN